MRGYTHKTQYTTRTQYVTQWHVHTREGCRQGLLGISGKGQWMRPGYTNNDLAGEEDVILAAICERKHKKRPNQRTSVKSACWSIRAQRGGWADVLFKYLWWQDTGLPLNLWSGFKQWQSNSCSHLYLYYLYDKETSYFQTRNTKPQTYFLVFGLQQKETKKGGEERKEKGEQRRGVKCSLLHNRLN